MEQSNTPTPRVGVGVIILKDGKVLLGQRKNAHGAGTWAFPGGRLEFGESLEMCAMREVLEETGLVLRGVRKYDFADDIFPENNTHYVTLFMIADTFSGKLENREPDKCEGWDWFEVNALPEPLFRPIQTLIMQERHGEEAQRDGFQIFRCKDMK